MVYCQSCGAEVASGAGYCSDCGTEIGDGMTVAEQPTHEHPGEDGIAWKHLLKVGVIALLPAIVLAVVLPGAITGIGLLIGIPAFAYLGYQRPTVKTAFGRLSFWTAIALFMSPIFMVIHTFIFTESQTQGSAETAGAALGGTILVIAAFVIGVPVGIGFYLLSKRYSIEK